MSTTLKKTDKAKCPKCGAQVLIANCSDGSVLQLSCSRSLPGVHPKDGICDCDDDLNSTTKTPDELIKLWNAGIRGWAGPYPKWMNCHASEEESKDVPLQPKERRLPEVKKSTLTVSCDESPQMDLFS